MATGKQRAAASFSLALACAGAFLYIWYETNGFAHIGSGFMYTLFIIGWLLFNAFRSLR